MKKYKSILIALLVVIASNLATQPVNKLVGDVVMPSADATAMNKYNDIPVDPSTGVPNISIPIHGVNHGGLSIPIVLNYHSSGIKVAENASWVGLGWNLTAGGSITRSVLGIPDEDPNGYYNIGAIINSLTEGSGLSSDAELFRDISIGVKDGEPDLYSFSFPGYSGKFTFDHNKNVVLMPQQDLKIVPGASFLSFSIISPDGTEYIFNETESTVPGTSPSFVSSWHLTKVNSKDDKYCIDLNYTNNTYENIYPASYNKSYYLSTPTGCDGNLVKEGYSGNAGVGNSLNSTLIQGKLVSTIVTPTETISFISETAREDLPNSASNRLDAIMISSDFICKKYNFGYEYFVDNSSNNDPNIASCYKRLKLKELQEESCDQSIVIPPYEFSYEGDIVNSNTYLPNRLTKSIDHWGYYNNSSNYLDLNIPSTTFDFQFGQTTITEGGSDRESDEDAMKKGVLKKIKYPTGGETEIVLEANEVNSVITIKNQFVGFSNCGSPLITACCQGGIVPDNGPVTMTASKISNGVFKLYLTDVSGYLGQGSCISGTVIPMSITLKAHLGSASGTQVGEYTFNHSYNPNSSTSSQEIHSDEMPLSNFFNFIADNDYVFTIEVINGKGGVVITEDIEELMNKKVGGLRVKQLITFDGVSAGNNTIRDYDYTSSESTESSGRLINMPRYLYDVAQLPHGMISLNSNSIVPLYGAEGYHIRYERVVESMPGNGYKEYIYDVSGVFEGVNTYKWPILPPQFLISNKNGPKESVVYDNAGSEVAKSISVYNNVKIDDISKAWRISKHTCSTNGGPAPTWGHSSSYYINTGRVRLVSSTEVLDGVSKTTETEYDPSNRFGFPTAMEYTNSDGKLHRTEYQYLYDYPDISLRSDLVTKNIIESPFKTLSSVDGVQVDGTETEYGWFNSTTGQHQPNSSLGFPRLYKVYRYLKSWDENNNVYGPGKSLEASINKYDSNGHISQVTYDGWSPETFTWNSVTGLLLQKKYLNHVSDYAYYPGTRLLSSNTDVDGQVTAYSYDKLMRLASTSSRAGNLNTAHDYKYSGQSSTHPEAHIKTQVSFSPITGSGLTTRNSYAYVDGLGRNIQQVQQQHSDDTTPKDVYTATIFDAYGRPIESFEPLKSGLSNGGSISSLPVGNDVKTITRYENSPLNRVLGVTPPSWHETTTAYGTNSQAMTIAGVNYPSESLMTTSVLDPNVSNGSLRDIEFKDKLGRVVLTRRTDGTQNNDTQYSYDDKGRVFMVIPPGATVNDLGSIYQYVYDERDRIIKKKVPDQDWMHLQYDDRDLVTYTQDGNMRAVGRWMHSHYDDYGRLLESGFVNSDPADGDEVMSFDLALTRNCYDGCAFAGTVPQIYTGKLQRSETRVLGTNDWLSQTVFYDNYGRVERTEGNNILNFSNALAEEVSYTYDYADNILQQSRSHLGIDVAPISIKDFTTIDQAGRLAATDQEIDGNRFKINDLNYTVKDQINSKLLGHSSGNWLQEIDFSYLPNGFLKGINDGSIYDSNLLGVDACTPQVPDGGSPQSSLSQNDLFTMNLYYDTQVGFQTSSSIQKNGNISGVKWRTRGRAAQAYGYTYDYLNRLTLADHSERNQANSGYLVNKYNSIVSYDQRGNIATLNRTGKAFDGAGCLVEGEIDDLGYTYTGGSNRFADISENASNSGNPNNAALIAAGFKGYSTSQTGANYLYDDNGNMIYDPSKGLTIHYNYLNLPERFEFEDCRVIQISYDAAGTKLKQVLHNGQREITSRIYAGGIEYNNGSLEAIYHAEGRTYFEDGTNRQEFNLSDHLGNRRLTYSDLNGNGRIDMTTNPETNEVLDEKNYYAFGMEMTGNWLKDKGRASNYLYNGKEFSEDLGLYDYGARWYDPAVARWNAVDPLADGYGAWSPYNYVLGNPIRNIDPDGRSVDDIIIRTRDDKGNYNTALVIESELIDLTIDIDFKLDDVISNSEGKGISTYPFPVIRNVGGATFDEFLKRGGDLLPDAYSIDIEAEAAPGGGIGGELSFTHFLSGPDKGNVYLYAQVNGLVGIEGGAGVSFNSYYSDIPERDFDRNTLQGPERGLSGSFGGYEASRFVGLSFSGKSTSPYFTESTTYHGYSAGASFGSDTAASGSAYFGYAKLMGKLFSF